MRGGLERWKRGTDSRGLRHALAYALDGVCDAHVQDSTGGAAVEGYSGVGRLGTETAKRVDTYATALFAGLTVKQVSDLDLSYTPPLGSPWDAVQIATQTWTRTHTGG